MFAPTNLPFYTIFDSDAGLSENGFHVLKLRQIAISKQKMTINHGDNYTFFPVTPISHTAEVALMERFALWIKAQGGLCMLQESPRSKKRLCTIKLQHVTFFEV